MGVNLMYGLGVSKDLRMFHMMRLTHPCTVSAVVCASPTCRCLSAEENDGGGLQSLACQANVTDLSHGIGWNGQMSENGSLKCLSKQNQSCINFNQLNKYTTINVLYFKVLKILNFLFC